MKKKMQFLKSVSSNAGSRLSQGPRKTYMMPKTHEALSMAQRLFTVTWGNVPEMVQPRALMPCESPRVQLEQSASAMPRSS